MDDGYVKESTIAVQKTVQKLFVELALASLRISNEREFVTPQYE